MCPVSLCENREGGINKVANYIDTYHGDHDKSSCSCPLSQVLERIGDGPVPVEAEDEEVEDGRCAGRVVDPDPELAEGHSEQPVLRKDVNGADWHDEQTYDEIGHGQTDDEHVAHLLIVSTHVTCHVITSSHYCNLLLTHSTHEHVCYLGSVV